jgi:two-component system, LytTR family, response regulator
LKIPCCIVEDEEPAIELLKLFIQQHELLDLQVTYYNPTQIEKKFLDGSYLFFMDIQMPFQSGLDFLKAQQSATKIPVILTTSYAQHGVEAFNLSALDYLLKPFSRNRFDESIQKASIYFKGIEPAHEEKYIWVTDDYKKTKINVSDILYLEGLKQYVKIHTTTKRYMLIQTLKSFEEELSGSGFIRCHKSYLVNTSFVTNYSASSLYIQKIELPIGKQYADVFKDGMQS